MQDFGGQYGGGGAPSGPGWVTHGSRTGRKERAGHVQNSEKCPRSRRSTCESLGREELRVCEERRGLGECGRTVAVGDVGSCGALGSTSDTLGFCSESNEKPLEDFGQGHACSRVHFTRISPDLCGGEALGGRRETCGDELGHYGRHGRGCVLRWGCRGGLRGAET